jgi:predicted phosphoribosyltransferase
LAQLSKSRAVLQQSRYYFRTNSNGAELIVEEQSRVPSCLSMMTKFLDRHEAGQLLARKLSDYAGRDDVLVLALPRGGVPVAAAVADILNVPMDIFVVRKLGLPGQPELAMGAIATGGVRVLNDAVVDALNVPPEVIDAVSAEEEHELKRREYAYRHGRPPLNVEGKTVIVVDDGVATGSTVLAAVAALRSRGSDLSAVLEERYAESHVVDVLPEGVVPELARIQQTDGAEIGVFEDALTGDSIVICALDNLGKGAAGQAIQNVNLLFGLDETTGLRLSGVLV